MESESKQAKSSFPSFRSSYVDCYQKMPPSFMVNHIASNILIKKKKSLTKMFICSPVDSHHTVLDRYRGIIYVLFFLLGALNLGSPTLGKCFIMEPYCRHCFYFHLKQCLTILLRIALTSLCKPDRPWPSYLPASPSRVARIQGLHPETGTCLAYLKVILSCAAPLVIIMTMRSPFPV